MVIIRTHVYTTLSLKYFPENIQNLKELHIKAARNIISLIMKAINNIKQTLVITLGII